MGISYKPLFKLMIDRGMTKSELHTELGLSSATLAKLSKGKALSGSNIEKLCNYFRCQVQDIVEIIWTDETKKEAAEPVKATRRKSKRDAK